MNLDELRAKVVEWLGNVKTWYLPDHSWADYILTDSEWLAYKWPLGMPSDCKPDNERTFHVHFFTEEHEYHINVYLRDDGTAGMMGFASARKPRPGENWTRGNDMPDGPFTEETFRYMIFRMFGYELLAKVKEAKHDLVKTLIPG